jgi:hypothetical protein
MKKNSITLLLLGYFLLPITIYAQNGLTERDIVRSGKYFFGHGTSIDTIKARQDARDDLMANISN